LPRDTNILYFHTLVEQDACLGHLLNVSIHKHQVVDWQYMLEQPVMCDLVAHFNQIGLYQFLATRCDYNEMIIRQFYATAVVNMDAKTIEWIIGKRKYEATFKDFHLDYDMISAGVNLIEEDVFTDIRQFYELASLGIRIVLGQTTGLRHHSAVINKVARVTILPKGGDRSMVRDKFWNIINHVLNGNVMDVVTFMMNHVSDLKVDKNINTPYIMALILAKTKFKRTCETTHTLFRPFKMRGLFLKGS
jgi:hypothetical protein